MQDRKSHAFETSREGDIYSKFKKRVALGCCVAFFASMSAKKALDR